jgi:GNAT superfamily N-acetyltransferase
MDPVDILVPPATVGDRVVLRTLLPDGSATDVIGWVAAVDSEQVTLEGLQATSTVHRSRVVAARRLPAALGGPGPQRTSPEELEQISLPGWVAHSEPLGEWTLRYGGGFTGRANSCLAVGHPGMDVAEAAARIVAFAARHQTQPWAQVVAGGDVEHRLRGLGWTEAYVRTDVLAVRLNELLGAERPDPRVRVLTSLGPGWQDAYQISRPNSAEAAVLHSILDGRPPRAFAQVEADGDVIAIGRAHVNQSWMGLASLWTVPAHRRRGWATKIMTALGHWAARQGARNVYLQVATENSAAHRAYQRAGFAVHHSYLYLAPPATGQCGRDTPPDAGRS